MISLRCLHIIIGVVFEVWVVFRCLGILQTMPMGAMGTISI